jgi:hypothetical protein
VSILLWLRGSGATDCRILPSTSELGQRLALADIRLPPMFAAGEELWGHIKDTIQAEVSGVRMLEHLHGFTYR